MSRNKTKKRQEELLNRQSRLKEEPFDFERISLFFQNDDHKNARQVIDERVLNDLDFEELFMSLDRTVSVVGQQYLYATLRVLPESGEKALSFEPYIAIIKDHKIKKKAITVLSGLKDHGGYTILAQRYLTEY